MTEVLSPALPWQDLGTVLSTSSRHSTPSQPTTTNAVIDVDESQLQPSEAIAGTSTANPMDVDEDDEGLEFVSETLAPGALALPPPSAVYHEPPMLARSPSWMTMRGAFLPSCAVSSSLALIFEIIGPLLGRIASELTWLQRHTVLRPSSGCVNKCCVNKSKQLPRP